MFGFVGDRCVEVLPAVEYGRAGPHVFAVEPRELGLLIPGFPRMYLTTDSRALAYVPGSAHQSVLSLKKHCLSQ